MLASMRVLVIALILMSLGGCGSSAPPSEQIIIDYIDQYNKALRDDTLVSARKQISWSEDLGAFFLPEGQLRQTQALSASLGLLINFGGAKAFQIENLVLEPVEETANRATYRIDSGDLLLTSNGQKYPQPFEQTGLGNKRALIEVVQLDGRWYIVPPR